MERTGSAGTAGTTAGARPTQARDVLAEACLAHRATLRSAALRLTHSPADADDLVQTTLVRALTFWDHFEPGTNLRGWLLRILRNTFINQHRRRLRERAVSELAVASGSAAQLWYAPGVSDGEATYLASAQRARVAVAVSEAFERVPAQFRAVVELSDVRDQSYREIAEALDCPIGTVMSRLHRGRRLLRAELREQALELGLSLDDTADAAVAASTTGAASASAPARARAAATGTTRARAPRVERERMTPPSAPRTAADTRAARTAARLPAARAAAPGSDATLARAA